MRTRRLLSIVSVAALVVGVLAFLAPSLQTLSGPSSSAADPAPGELFPEFPVGRGERVSLEMDPESRLRLTDREQRDQALDWLFLAALSESGVSRRELVGIAHDLSPIRHGYSRPLAAFEYGRTRSRFLRDGAVLALVPAGDAEAERLDLYAHVADRHRKDLGKLPARLIVFEYELAAGWGEAELRRLEDVAVEWLYTNEAGYHAARVESLADLGGLMRQVEDVTMVRRLGTSLELGGRRALSRPYRTIGPEDVAALWQADQRLAEVAAEIEAFDRRWSSRTYSTESERTLLEIQLESERAELERRLGGADGLRMVDGTGFSLDPIYHFPVFREVYGEIRPTLRARALAGQPSLLAREEEAAEGLDSDDPAAFLELADHLARSESPAHQDLSSALRLLNDTVQLQAARYDGDLQGTEVGMVLFYTDLLAKLWAIDFVGETPRGPIPEFRPLHRIAPSPVFAAEMAEYSNARLWFGPRDDGFQVEADGAGLLFARNATRVYAASSNPLRPGEEVEPSAAYEAFLGWWNDHYEEIAAFEPEYERLNQIMKWSLVISWLSERDASDALAFLAEVEVGRTHWFPEWARRQERLRFDRWDDIEFFPRGSLGRDTEVLPQLSGERSERWAGSGFSRWAGYSGGVSLAPRRLFETRPAITETVPSALRRSWHASTRTAGDAVEAFDGTAYRLVGSPDRPTVRVSPREKVRLRDGFGQMVRRDVERSFSRTSDDALRVTTRADDGARGLDLGSLEIERGGGGFRVAWESREVDVAQALARRASTAEDLVTPALAEPAVGTVVELRRGVAVELHGSRRWLRLVSDEQPAIELPEGFHARVADPAGQRVVNLAWEDRGALAGRLAGAERVVLSAPREGGPLVLRYPRGRAPPGGRRVEIETSDGTLAGRFDPGGGTLTFQAAELPEALRHDPSGLRDAVGAERLRTIRTEVGGSAEGPPVRIAGGGGGRGARRHVLVDDLERGDHREVARAIAADPVAAHGALRDHLRGELGLADRLIAEGRTERAIAKLAGLERRHGSHPDITVRRALAELDRARPEGAVRALERGLGRPTSHREALFDELQLRIEGAGEARRSDLRQIERIAVWNELHAADPGLAGRIELRVEGGRLTYDYRLASLPAPAVESKAAVSGASRAPAVYVQDSPALANVDWSPGVEATLRELSAGELARVVRLPRGDLSHFRPARIYTPEDVPLRRLEPARLEPLPAGSAVWRSVRPQLVAPPDGGDDDDREGEVFLVMEAVRPVDGA